MNKLVSGVIKFSVLAAVGFVTGTVVAEKNKRKAVKVAEQN